MTDFELSPRQIEVIDALSNGASMTAAADQAGLHRNTIANWRRSHLAFQSALIHARHDRALFYREKVEDLAGLAIESLRDALSNPETPPSVRVRAALSILNTITTPPEPQRALRVEIGSISPTNVPEPDGDNPGGTPAPSLTEITAQLGDWLAARKMHNSAQSTPVETIRRDHPKLGRNDLCPCGSGAKYKRCCLGKQTSTPGTQAA
jgi:hypothetical protein